MTIFRSEGLEEMTDYKNYRPSRKRQFAIRALAGIAVFSLIFSAYAFVEQRDRQHAEEMEQMHQTVAAVHSECGPTIELSMPIEPGSVKL